MSKVIELPRGAHLRVKTHRTRGTTTQLEMIPDGISNEALRALCRPKSRRSFVHASSIRLRRSKLYITLPGTRHQPPSQTTIDETIDHAAFLLSANQAMHNRKPENSRRHRRRSTGPKVDRRPRFKHVTAFSVPEPMPLTARP